LDRFISFGYIYKIYSNLLKFVLNENKKKYYKFN
jgi:hypothetical protein